MSTQVDWLTTSATHARLRADDGIARARKHADAVRKNWTDRAVDTLRAWAAGRGEFLFEDFRAAGLVSDPPDYHAWGAVTRTAARRGVIVATGNCKPAWTSNGSLKPTWRLARP